MVIAVNFPAAYYTYDEILGYETPVAGVIGVKAVVAEGKVVVVHEGVAGHVIGRP